MILEYVILTTENGMDVPHGICVSPYLLLIPVNYFQAPSLESLFVSKFPKVTQLTSKIHERKADITHERKEIIAWTLQRRGLDTEGLRQSHHFRNFSDITVKQVSLHNPKRRFFGSFVVSQRTQSMARNYI
jgi:hypothetical protein